MTPINTDWMQAGACRHEDPALFFGGVAELNQARRICSRCPVQRQCADYALAHEEHGTWAGMSERERDRLRKSRGIRLQSPSLRAVRK